MKTTFDAGWVRPKGFDPAYWMNWDPGLKTATSAAPLVPKMFPVQPIS